MGDSKRESEKSGRASQRQLIKVIRDDAAGELAFYSDDNDIAGAVALAATSRGLTARRFRSHGAEQRLGAIKMVVRDERPHAARTRIPVVIDVREAS